MKTGKIIFWLFSSLGLIVFVFVGFNFFGQFIRDKNVFTASLAQNTIQSDPVEFQMPPVKPDEIILEDEVESAFENESAFVQGSGVTKQDQIDDILEKLDVLRWQLAQLTAPPKPEPEKVVEKSEEKPPEAESIQPGETLELPSSLPQNVVASARNVVVYPSLLISEVQVAGLADDQQEFVELYNPNAQDVDLTDWYVQRKTKTGASFSSFAPSTLFAGKKIIAKGYFLIVREGSGLAFDIMIDHPLTEDNSLVLKNPHGEIADTVGFGAAQQYETAPVQNPLAGQSIGRKFIAQAEQDTNNNLVDFEVDSPTPRAQNLAYVAPVQTAPLEEEISVPLKILINEIQTTGISAKDEFIELYNPNATDVNLTGFALKKKTSSGNESNLVSAGSFFGSVKAHGYFLIAPQNNDDGTKNYSGLVEPDLRYSGKTFSIAHNNTILLYDAGNVLLDKVGFGQAGDFETAPTQNPLDSKSISRNVTFDDTDDNAVDFAIYDANPQNSQYAPPAEPAAPEDPVPVPEEPVLLEPEPDLEPQIEVEPEPELESNSEPLPELQAEPQPEPEIILP